MYKLLTKKDLAGRWQVSENAIDKWRREGIITSVQGIPSVRFSQEYIAELEGTKLEKFSPLERRRLEARVEQLKKENEMLKDIVSKILAESSKVINL
ncbi:MAG: histidine kinase [Clostridium lundense]|nr:histidine kinase [Clostridium lundense]